MARLFNEKHTHPLLYTGMAERTFSLEIFFELHCQSYYCRMAERTFSLEIQWFEPVITLNCSIICIGKQGKLYSLNFIFHVIPTNWNLALPYHCKFLFSRIIIYTFRLDTKFFSQIKLNCSLIFLINVQF